MTGRHVACPECGSVILVAVFAGTALSTCSNERCDSHLTVNIEDTQAIREEMTRRIHDGDDYPRRERDQ
jgi:hypothetical protein